jgi:alpha-glucoside transport system substrate-binding protein
VFAVGAVIEVEQNEGNASMSAMRKMIGCVGACVAVAGVTAGCGSSSSSPTTASSPATTKTTSSVSGTVSVDGVWTGAEASSFRAVIAAFNKSYPNVKVDYASAGDNLPTVLATSISGGNPPDMADIAQPGLIQQFVNRGALKPIPYASADMKANFSPAWNELGTFNGKLYGVVFKASNKSTVWYDTSAFGDAGVNPPSTWSELLTDAKTLRSSGIRAYSIAGADGWTLTDLFENIYLRQAGATKYKELSDHSIAWTDPSVKKALKTVAQVLGDTSNIYGGTAGALQTDFPTSVNHVLQQPAKAALLFEGDFVPGVATDAKGYGEFAFPSVAGSPPAVEIGGDTMVTFRDTPAIRAFVRFLTTPQAATAWARRGGFATGNEKMSTRVYPDAITRKTAAPVAHASSVVFDMSDEQPAAFGATVGQGEWGIFQDFLRHPGNVNSIAQRLETAAARAYAKQG